MENRVVFRNQGVLDLRAITIMGVSVKMHDNPIGQFGTGLKYALAILARHELKVSLIVGDYFYRLRADKITIREKEFQQLFLDRIVDLDTEQEVVVETESLPFTTELGKKWELWMAFRELYSNAIDEKGEVYPTNEDTPITGGETAIIVEGEEFVKILFDKGDVFLSSKPKLSVPELDIHEGETKAVFHKGIRVAEFEKPLMHKYDIQGYASLTEDRTLSNSWMFDRQVTTAVGTSMDEEFITKMVTAPKEFHEAGLNYDNVSIPSETFLKTLKSLIKRAKDKVNPTAVRLYEELVRKRRKETKARKEAFRIQVDIPEGVSLTEMKLHIVNSLIQYKGDFKIDPHSVQVSAIEDDDKIPF